MLARNLDLTALRSFVAVADVGGVTRAAGLLNLTQSAVSMQIKRLEEGIGLGLFARSARRLSLTPEGEQLLSYARRMLTLNDEALARLTGETFEGEIRLGVPHDIVQPALPQILKRMAADFPRVRINLVSSFTSALKEEFARGEFDMILTTEEAPSAGASELCQRHMIWVGAEGGAVWQRQPLRLGFHEACIFKPRALAALDAAGIAWEMAVAGLSEPVVETMLAADLAISVRMSGSLPPHCAPLPEACGLPELGVTRICLYEAGRQSGPVIARLREELMCGFGPQ